MLTALSDSQLVKVRHARPSKQEAFAPGVPHQVDFREQFAFIFVNYVFLFLVRRDLAEAQFERVAVLPAQSILIASGSLDRT